MKLKLLLNIGPKISWQVKMFGVSSTDIYIPMSRNNIFQKKSLVTTLPPLGIFCPQTTFTTYTHFKLIIPGICRGRNGSQTHTETTHTTIVLRLSNTIRVVALSSRVTLIPEKLKKAILTTLPVMWNTHNYRQ